MYSVILFLEDTDSTEFPLLPLDGYPATRPSVGQPVEIGSFASENFGSIPVPAGSWAWFGWDVCHRGPNNSRMTDRKVIYDSVSRMKLDPMGQDQYTHKLSSHFAYLYGIPSTRDTKTREEKPHDCDDPCAGKHPFYQTIHQAEKTLEQAVNERQSSQATSAIPTRLRPSSSTPSKPPRVPMSPLTASYLKVRMAQAPPTPPPVREHDHMHWNGPPRIGRLDPPPSLHGAMMMDDEGGPMAASQPQQPLPSPSAHAASSQSFPLIDFLRHHTTRLIGFSFDGCPPSPTEFSRHHPGESMDLTGTVEPMPLALVWVADARSMVQRQLHRGVPGLEKSMPLIGSCRRRPLEQRVHGKLSQSCSAPMRSAITKRAPLRHHLTHQHPSRRTSCSKKWSTA